MNSKLGEIICKIRASDYEVNTQYHTPIREMLSLGRPEYFYLPCGDQK